MVERVHPFECCELNGFEVAPRSSPMDDLGLVKAVDRCGERIVVAVTDTSDGRLDACLGQSLGTFDRDVLDAAIAVMDETATMTGRRA